MDMPNDWDVLVVGGGVAGCAVGTFLAQAGLRVLILEKGRHPRHHVGESLLPASMPILESLGLSMQKLAMQHQPKYGARFCDSALDRCETFSFSTPGDLPPSFQVLREDFDADLKSRCIANGCRYEENCRITTWRPVDGGVEVYTSDQQIHRAKFLVIAAGRARLSCSAADGLSDSRDISNGFGHLAIYNYYPNLPPAMKDERAYITVHLIANGWIWCIPLRNGDTSIGVVLKGDSVRPGVDHREQFEVALRNCPELHHRLMGLLPRCEFRAAADYSYHSTVRYGDRWVKIGDSGGFLDPIFSSGVHLALTSAQLAAQAINSHLSNGDTGGLEAFRQKMDWAEMVFEAFIDRFYNRDLVRQLFFADYRPPHIKAAFTNVLAGYVWDRTNPVIAMFAGKRHEPSVSEQADVK